MLYSFGRDGAAINFLNEKDRNILQAITTHFKCTVVPLPFTNLEQTEQILLKALNKKK
jgi:hypothetical protein